VDHHLAQLNVGRLLAPLDDPATAGFVAGLEPINAVADAAPGFVWRLQDDTGDATHIRAHPDPLFIVNLSVWESLEDLAAFVYEGAHVPLMRRRREWFSRMATAHLVLWWVPAGTRPTPAEALDRLDLLERHGPSPAAFTFRRPFAAPAGTPLDADERWGCPTG
jgi:hypothetical protein